jgi:LPS O-antigen subunit length determinant protein (WzzB/FepE family)
LLSWLFPKKRLQPHNSHSKFRPRIIQRPVSRSSLVAPQDDDEISLLDLLIVLAKHKRLILGLPLIAAVLAAGYSVQIPNTYTATTRVLPPQIQSSALISINGTGTNIGQVLASKLHKARLIPAL